MILFLSSASRIIIDLFTDTAAILILIPGHPIVLIEIYSFVVIMQHYHNYRINLVLWDAQGAKSIWLLYW